jgi:integrase
MADRPVGSTGGVRQLRTLRSMQVRPQSLSLVGATAALRAGVPVKVVSERLGHSSIAFTQQAYMHVIPGMNAEGARLEAADILGTVSPLL